MGLATLHEMKVAEMCIDVLIGTYVSDILVTMIQLVYPLM